MRTLLLCPELFAHEGGIQRILRLYLKALCELGDEVHLLVLNDSGFRGSELFRYADDQLRTSAGCGGNKWSFVRGVIRIAGQVDRIIAGHIGQLPACWLAKQKYRGIDYYLIAHGIEVWRSYSAIERIALRMTKRVLCVSEYTKGAMQQRLPLAEDQYRVVPNALDPLFAASPATSTVLRSAPVILTVSRLNIDDRYKGVEDLIRAMPMIRNAMPGTLLRIVGSGDDRHRLENLTRTLCAPESVVFCGFLDDESLVREYENCALFALPSAKEGFGIVYLEAMAHGKPCLGASAGAVPEVINEMSGLLVPYGDIEQITSCCVRALKKTWSTADIRNRAEEFSYSRLRTRLCQALRG